MTASTQNAWKALPFVDVSKTRLEEGLSEQGVDWRTSLHVTATSSLARAMRDESWPAISIKELTDLVIWSGMPGNLHLPADLPILRDGLEAFGAARVKWRRRLRGRSTLLLAESGDALRDFLDRSPNRDEARVLRRSTSELLLSIRSLASAGIHPEQLDRSSASALVEVAIEAWEHLENAVPHLFGARDDLWIPRSELETPVSERARDLWRRVDAAIAGLMGDVPRWPLVYHGFYFFTPPQWAWFTLMKEHNHADQYFVIHDDGNSRVYEVWRRFFDERWGMPTWSATSPAAAGPMGELLLDALEGRHVDTRPLGSTPNVIRLTEFRDVGRFAANTRLERDRATAPEGEAPFRLYAADAADIDRLARRFGFGTIAAPELADTALGQFFLSLHACVRVDADGKVGFELTDSRLIDMAASGLLDGDATAPRPSQHLAAIHRALPFFEGLDHPQDWVDRARSLRHLTSSIVSMHGSRTTSTGDVERIRTAAGNPLRLASWCDLSDEEALAVWHAVERVKSLCDLLEEQLARRGRVTPREYLSAMRKALRSAMAGLSQQNRDAIAGTLRQQSLTGDRALSIEGVIELVGMQLRRALPLEADVETDDDDVAVEELRNLDALGFAPSRGVVHLANLADTVFPSRVSTIGWPFDRHLLEVSQQIRPESREISRAREEVTGLADLYLFWLALHAVRDGGSLHLSTIQELGSEHRNPSPILTLIAEVEAGRGSEQIARRAGGLKKLLGADEEPVTASPTSVGVARGARSDIEIDRALRRLDRISVASAEICPRRFALQWVLGSSHSFPADFQHKMLFGNVHGALAREPQFELTEQEAYRIVRDAWRHLTPGERLSSLRRRRVYPTNPYYPSWWRGPRPLLSSDWRWLFTLGGTKGRGDPTDNAYDAARGQRTTTVDQVAPPDCDTAFLPPGNPSYDLCKMCPARPGCSAASLVDDD